MQERNIAERKAAEQLRRLDKGNKNSELEISISYKESVSHTEAMKSIKKFRKSIQEKVVRKPGAIY